MWHKITGLLLLSFVPIIILAQDKIEADRPTEAQSVHLVPKGVFQAEIGFRKDHEHERDYRLQHPNAVFRYGLLEGLELRLETTAETERFYTKNSFHYGLRPVEVGIKANIYQTKDSSFSSSLYGQLGLPRLSSKDHRHHEVFYRIRLLFQNELSDKIKLNYNVGQDWGSEERRQNWIYAISPQFELSDKWEVFFEEYSFISRGNKPEHYVDGGFAYYIRKDLSLDIDVGKGLSSQSANYFVTAGVSAKW